MPHAHPVDEATSQFPTRATRSSARFLALLSQLLEVHEQELATRDEIAAPKEERRTAFASKDTVVEPSVQDVLVVDTDSSYQRQASRSQDSLEDGQAAAGRIQRRLEQPMWASVGDPISSAMIASMQKHQGSEGGTSSLVNFDPQRVQHHGVAALMDKMTPIPTLRGSLTETVTPGARLRNSGGLDSATSTKMCTSSSPAAKHLQLRACWKSHPDNTQNDADQPYASPRAHRRSTAPTKSRTSSNRLSLGWRSGGFSSRALVSAPSANWRMIWDVLGAIFIGYDTIWIPFVLSFRPPRHWLFTSVDLVTMAYWTVDIAFSFFVGYHDQGNLVMSPVKISRHYLTTWFLLDVAVVTFDWINTLGTHRISQMGGVGQLARSLRVIRIARLLRLLKLKRFAAQLQDTISSETAFLILSLIKLLFFILTLNHCIACLWFYVGWEGNRHDEPNWISANSIRDVSLGYQYTTSLHWTLTQFTPASMEVFPQNTVERSMAVVVLIFALVAFSSFVGSISASVTTLRNINADTNKQFWLLRRFLKTHSVPKNLVFRIIKYLEYALEKREGTVQISSLKVLHHLSEQLEEELHLELRRTTLATHPLLSHLMHEMEVVLRRLCGQALKSLTLASEDSLFYAGDEGINMYCFTAGSLTYMSEDQGQGSSLEPPPQHFEWISEASLWVNWKHMGKLRAHTESEFTAVNSAKFAEVIRKNVTSWYPTALYACTWVSHWAFQAADIPRDAALIEAVQKELRDHGTFRSARRVWGDSLANTVLDPRRDTTDLTTTIPMLQPSSTVDSQKAESLPYCSRGSGTAQIRASATAQMTYSPRLASIGCSPVDRKSIEESSLDTQRFDDDEDSTKLAI